MRFGFIIIFSILQNFTIFVNIFSGNYHRKIFFDSTFLTAGRKGKTRILFGPSFLESTLIGI